MTVQTQPRNSQASAQRCHELPFDLVSTCVNNLVDVPLTHGFCLPQGTLWNEFRGTISGGNDVQTEVLNRWHDGSVRWLLAHFVANHICPGRSSHTLQLSDVAASVPAAVSADSATLKWNAGEVSLRMTCRTSKQVSETRLCIAPRITNAAGRSLPVNVTSVHQESDGPVRSVWRIEATVPGAKYVQLQLRMELWHAPGVLQVSTRIRNTRRARHRNGLWDLGDPGSYRFQGLHLNISSPDSTVTELWFQPDVKAEARTVAPQSGIHLIQHGSGGAAWACTNHVDEHGQSTVPARGYHAIVDGDTMRGHRAEPTVSMKCPDTQLSVAVPEFWQQFPGSLDVDHRTISVGLFPVDSMQLFELQGGEQKTQSVVISAGPHWADMTDLTWVYQPAHVVQSAESIAAARVFPWLPVSVANSCEHSVTDCDDADHNADHNADIVSQNAARYLQYIDEAMNGDFSVDARREKIDEYGWRNFGDVPADHEQSYYKGRNTIISHYNNQFDLIYGAILNFATSGDVSWTRLFGPLARHVMDIDIYHTSQDRAVFNGGLFWHTDHYVDAHTATHRTYSRQNAAERRDYGGGLCCEHNYTTGLLHYFYLTGDPEARESVISLAEWVIAMEDGSRTIWSVLDSGPTGLSTNTVFDDFHGPGRGAGNSINALIDAWTLSCDDRYLQHAEMLIRRVVHPAQNQDELHLLDAEGHWSYTVCLTALGRYLSAKLDVGQLDDMYSYVRETLRNYGRWMAESERRTLSEPDRLQYPTEAWAAQDFRKANALRICAACSDDADEELRMRRKAEQISDAAWHDLYSFDKQHLTARCLSILMTEGLRDVFHRTCPSEHMPRGKKYSADPDWQMFVPQKQRVRNMLRNPRNLIRAAARMVSPAQCLRTVDAVRRQL